jgi:hypothetical protein
MAAPAGVEAMRRRIEELEGRELRALWRCVVARTNQLLRRLLKLKSEFTPVERPLR